MRGLANRRNDIKAEFEDLANCLEQLLDGTDMRALIGIWTRARRRWSLVTGEK